MDALTYEIQGKLECRHTCGHDAHCSIVLAVARTAALKGISRGKLVIIFQPAEEPILGALAMIQSKKLDNLGIEELYGLHVRSVDERECRFGYMSPAVFTSASDVSEFISTQIQEEMWQKQRFWLFMELI